MREIQLLRGRGSNKQAVRPPGTALEQDGADTRGAMERMDFSPIPKKRRRHPLAVKIITYNPEKNESYARKNGKIAPKDGEIPNKSTGFSTCLQ